MVLALGYFIGYIYNYGYGGLIAAGGFSVLMTLGSYYKGDKLALAVSGAKPIQKTDNPYLYRMVENLCIAGGLPMPKLHLIKDSTINAFATGRDPKHSSIAVTQGAIDKLENEELEGVLAHELSHVKNYDIRIMTIVIVLVGMVILVSDFMIRMQIFGRGHGRSRNSHPIMLAIGLLLMILAPLFAQIIKLAVSRKREYLADASGALLTRYPEGLANALEKIAHQRKPLRRANEATAHLYISNPFGSTRKTLNRLFSTHPPIQDRIKVLRNMA